MSGSDPLINYYRKVRGYVTLPSGNGFYNENVIDIADSGEIGIKAMSGDDEIILKNPDALMSGEAIKQVLLNCVDGLKKPEALLINDVDILLAKIRSISYGEGNNDLNTKCPKCEEENTFSVDLEALIDKSSHLEGEYSVTLSNDLQVFVTPFTYKDKIATLKVAFQQEKIKKSMVMSSEEEQLATLTSSIKMMTDLNYNLLTNSIFRLYDENNGIDIINSNENRKSVLSLLHNIETIDIDKIDKKVDEINAIGICKTMDAKCIKCGHEWEAGVDLNPVNFSIVS